MIYERLEALTVDVARLREHFERHVLPLPPKMTGPKFGGWSIQSGSGHYLDGWQRGHTCYTPDPATGELKFDQQKADAIGLRPSHEMIKPTQINFGYVRELVDRLEGLGLEPCRTRFSILKANSQGTLHRDAPDEVYSVRLHIPVITNEACTFHAGDEWAHLPADGGAYLVFVNRMHQIFNRSNEDRVHIIADVWDQKGVSTHHRRAATPPLKQLQV